MAPCDQELCPHWGGDGRVCECVLLDLEPGEAAQALQEQLGEEFADD